MLFSGITLLSLSILVWFFGTRKYVAKNKGIDCSGVNIAVSAWNDFSVAIEIQKSTKEKCISIELYALTQIGGFLLIAIGLLLLA